MSHDASGGHSTGIETMGTGTDNRRQRASIQLLNEYAQFGHTMRYDVYPCDGHRDHAPQYGCIVWVDGDLKGVANNEPNKKRAKEAAALEAVMSLLLAE